MYIGLHVKYRLFLSDFNETWIFYTYFGKIPKYQISWKSIQLEPICLKRMDRQTDMTKLTVACRSFAKAPKTWISYYNKKLHDFNSSPHSTWLMTSLRMIWRGHVSRVRERRKTYGLLVGKPERKRPLGGRPRRRWEDNIKMDLRKYKEKWINLAQDRRK